ncbi:hypothetical protein CATMIT_01549, partial [Catenibacterium mitsuokai DSM 15897]
ARAGVLVLGADVLLVGDQRHLRVDDHVPVFGQVQGHVRAALAVLGAVAFLHVVFLAAAQAGGLQHPLQHQFAPRALGLVGALERGGEVLGVLAERLVERHQLAHLLAQRGAVAGFVVVDGLDPGLELGQLLLQRIEQLAQVAAVLLGEAPALLFQDLVGEVAELRAELVAHLAQLGDLLLRLVALGVQLGRGAAEFDRAPVEVAGNGVALAFELFELQAQALQGLLFLVEFGAA